MTTLLLLALALYEPPASATIERGLPHVESRCNALAVSQRGARGRWQVMPRYARVTWWMLHVRPVGTWEGRRMLRRWQKRCDRQGQSDGQSHGQKQIVSMRCALRAYACGNAGLRGRCEGYAAAVMAAGGGE